MKALQPSDRPREKLLRHGVAALGDNELVALVIGSGNRHRGALDVANELLAARGGLHGVMRSTCDDLATIAGIGSAKAAQLVAALEMGRRTIAHAPMAKLRIQSPRHAVAHLMPAFGAGVTEQFGVLLLDTKHRVLRTAVVATGTSNATVVEPRDVFREAIASRAAAVVVFHNHPSGDPTPSAADLELTRRLSAAGILMGIEVVDHIILAESRYCSLKETGHM